MTLTVVNPPTGAYMGYGGRFVAHSSVTPAAGEFLMGKLTFVDAGGATRALAYGSGELSVGSGNASIKFGLTYFGTFQSTEPVDPRGVALGATIDLTLERYSPLSIFIETQFFAGYFKHDPVSQAPNLVAQLLSGLHDPMLDEILAAVRTEFPSS